MSGRLLFRTTASDSLVIYSLCTPSLSSSSCDSPSFVYVQALHIFNTTSRTFEITRLQTQRIPAIHVLEDNEPMKACVFLFE